MKRILVLALAAAMLLMSVSALAEITLEAAKQIALEKAGVAAGDAVFTKMHQDHDDGRAVYEIEFYAGDAEYDMDVDIATGEVTDFETEARVLVEAGGSISQETARQIALARVDKTEDEVKFTKTQLDEEDGRTVYEIEFVCDNVEYEFDIDASSGVILDFDADLDD